MDMITILSAAYVVGLFVVWFFATREIYRDGVEDRWTKRTKHRGNMRYAVPSGLFWAVAWPIMLALIAIVFLCMVAHEWIMEGDKS